MPRLRRSMGKFLIKNAVLGVARWKNLCLSTWDLLFVCCSWYVSRSGLSSIFSRQRRFLEIYSVLKKCWLHTWSTTMINWQTKCLGFGPARTFTFSIFHIFKLLYFKAYVLFTWHLESPSTDLLQFKHKCTYLFATNSKNKQYNRQEHP